VILKRYADDIDVGFELEGDARRFWDDMRKRASGRVINAAALKTAALFCGAGLFVWCSSQPTLSISALGFF
jgi:hypothetical protein